MNSRAMVAALIARKALLDGYATMPDMETREFLYGSQSFSD
jgi:hypothetical protein